MIKEYTFLAQLLAAGRSLQNLDLESSRTAPRHEHATNQAHTSKQ